MKIAFLDTVHEHLTSAFEEAGWQVDQLDQLSRKELKEIIHDYDGIILRSRLKMDEDFLSHALKLKFIGRPGAGLENIDLDYCESKKIKVFRSPEGNRDAVAEHCIGMLLSLFNHLKRADIEVRDGQWKREENSGFELKGKTVGILGYGYMGEAFAKRLVGFGVNVIAYDKYKSGFSSQYVNEVTEDELFKETDVLSIHIPQSPETIGLVNDDYLKNFRKDIYLINSARGKSVVLKDLLEALQNGKVLGACLDVLEVEKSSFENIVEDQNNPVFKQLLNSDRVLFSPHIAGWTFEAKEKMAVYLSDKILKEFNP